MLMHTDGYKCGRNKGGLEGSLENASKKEIRENKEEEKIRVTGCTIQTCLLDLVSCKNIFLGAYFTSNLGGRQTYKSNTKDRDFCSFTLQLHDGPHEKFSFNIILCGSLSA